MKLSEVALLVGLMSGIASVDAMESNENEYISTIYVKNTILKQMSTMINYANSERYR